MFFYVQCFHFEIVQLSLFLWIKQEITILFTVWMPYGDSTVVVENWVQSHSPFNIVTVDCICKFYNYNNVTSIWPQLNACTLTFGYFTVTKNTCPSHFTCTWWKIALLFSFWMNTLKFCSLLTFIGVPMKDRTMEAIKLMMCYHLVT